MLHVGKRYPTRSPQYSKVFLAWSSRPGIDSHLRAVGMMSISRRCSSSRESLLRSPVVLILSACIAVSNVWEFLRTPSRFGHDFCGPLSAHSWLWWWFGLGMPRNDTGSRHHIQRQRINRTRRRLAAGFVAQVPHYGKLDSVCWQALQYLSPVARNRPGQFHRIILAPIVA